MDLVVRTHKLLIDRNWTLSIAESCTGGLISHWVTSIPGSSRFFIGGVVAYSNAVKQQILRVPEEMLSRYGAVSEQVAGAMAEGVRRLLKTDVGISSTGIAGPSGGTPAKPVGTVFVGISSPLGNAVEHFIWKGDRAENKRLSAMSALRLIERQLG